MKKKISKKKELERKELRKKATTQKTVLILSAIPPFAFTLTTIILYAVIKKAFIWLLSVTAACWLLLGGLFIFAAKKRWGYVTVKGTQTEENSTVITVYNIVLVFALAALFIALLVKTAFF